MSVLRALVPRLGQLSVHNTSRFANRWLSSQGSRRPSVTVKELPGADTTSFQSAADAPVVGQDEDVTVRLDDDAPQTSTRGALPADAQEAVQSDYDPNTSSLVNAERLFPLWTANAPWTRQSVRVGLIAIKCGSIALWDENGSRMGLTVLCIDRCHVIRVQPPQSAKNLWSVQVGARAKRPYQETKAMRYHFAAAGVEPKYRLHSFPATADALLPPGTELTATHFKPGQHVDVTGTSKGKGTQGVMARWGFAGMPKSHGVTKAHRKGGSTGTRKIKTKKGRKMAGHVGNDNATTKARVYKVDGINNLLYLQGQVAGNAGDFVRVRDAFATRAREGADLPFPTRFITGNESPEELIQTADGMNRHVEAAQLYFTDWSPS